MPHSMDQGTRTEQRVTHVDATCSGQRSGDLSQYEREDTAESSHHCPICKGGLRPAGVHHEPSVWRQRSYTADVSCS